MDRQKFERHNITRIFQSRKTMKNPILIDLLNYWERLRAGRIAPLRSEIDPSAIENVLEHAFILERISNDNIRFRLAGMEISDLLGMEIRGMPASALIQPQDRAKFEAVLADLFEKPEIIEFELLAKRPQLPDQRAEMLVLPMKGESGKITRILGAIAVNGPKALPNIRFNIASTKVTRIVATAASIPRQSVFGFAEQATAFHGKPKQKAATNQSPPFLRVIK